ncbi:hypothetical protein [Nocardiopsis xinjiangensis]|uniref:hypothetical protein n=1 Tax=Nocardiopsis xinjiangensis TaxID=124285 RepID=UPI00034AFA88|nr:hypothetical protein [Nocardiopsis xinjiangensis]
MASSSSRTLAWLWDHRTYGTAIAGLLVALVGLGNLAVGETGWGWFSTIGGSALVLVVLVRVPKPGRAGPSVGRGRRTATGPPVEARRTGSGEWCSSERRAQPDPDDPKHRKEPCSRERRDRPIGPR